MDYRKTVEHLRRTADTFIKSGYAVDGIAKCFEESADTIEQLTEELKQYKDKQEQGLLIELPCKVGDTVYQIGKGHYEIGTDITEYTVTAITISQKDITISVKDKNQLGFPVSAIYLGKRLYLTRSEAEEALARMNDVSVFKV